MNVVQELSKYKNEASADFAFKLIPTVPRELFLGVKTKEIKDIAKKLNQLEDKYDFLNNLPHKYYEENGVHAMLISQMKDINEIFLYLEKFLPYVDNWAICDTMSPKIFKKYPKEVYNKILIWLKSKHTYTIRFGIVTLLQFYLEDNFHQKDLELISKIKSDEYYVNIAKAWYYSYALIKQYDNTISLFENKVLDKWVHNKSIQKAVESFRISDEKKEYLKKLRIK